MGKKWSIIRPTLSMIQTVRVGLPPLALHALFRNISCTEKEFSGIVKKNYNSNV